MKKESKTSKILKHLQEGKTITNLMATHQFKTTRLGGIIYILRKRGYNIETIAVENQDGGKYAKYRLNKEEVS